MSTSPLTEYIDQLPKEHQYFFIEIYDLVRAIVPDIQEGMSYGMPALIYKEKALISFALTKKHYGFYPMESEMITLMQKELEQEGLETTKGSIHFPLSKKANRKLLEKIIRFRKARMDNKLKTQMGAFYY